MRWDRVLKGRRPRFVAVAVAATITLLTATSAWGHPNPWVAASEGGLQSTEAIESEDNHPEKPNLCEGINGIPFGGDPGWARTNGSPDPGTPFVEARGQILPDLSVKTNPFVTHTDAPFNHYSHDINVFVTLDKGFRHLLASGNFEHFQDIDDPIEVENEHSMIELEWERSGIPFFAYPSQSDRITAWGPHVFDCGHGEEHTEFIPSGDPQNPTIIHHPTAFRTEIHSPVGWVAFRNTAAKSDRDQTPPPGKADQNPWVWYENTDHQGIATTLPSTPLKNTPVQATVADAFFSTYGGNIPESLNGCDDSTAVEDDTINAPCFENFGEDSEWAQPLLNQDYSFFVPAPPKPSAGSVLVWESVDRCGDVPHSPGNPPGDNVEDVSEADDGAENIGAPTCNIPDQVIETTQNGQPGVLVTAKAQSSDATYPSNNYVAFAKTYKVAWDEAKVERPRVFDVSFGNLRVFDDTEDQGNDGEWVVSLTANDKWLHPVRGSGDDNDPFWENGALDDGCDDDDACTYATGVSFNGIGIVPGEPLHVKMRGWDDDTTFIQDNDVNEVLPVVNVFHPLAELPGSFTKSGVNFMDTTDGAYTLGYTVSETTPAAPTLGTLTIGDPKYGPNVDTGGTATRISASTPLTFSGSDGTELQYKFWKDGATKPAAWITDTSAPFNVELTGASDGRYTIEYRPVSAGGVVGTPSFAFVELDTTPPVLTVPDDFDVYATTIEGAIVTYTFSAVDNLPGPVTASCTPASGSLFPNGKNAPLTTTVTCTATDIVNNTSMKTFDVTVTSPFGYVNDFVVIGEDWVRLGGTAVQVQSGNVGAFQASAGIPNRPGVEVEIGGGAVLTGGSQVAAHSVALGDGVTAGDVFYVDTVTAGVGSVYTPKIGYVPLFFGMPAFPVFSASGPNQNLNGTVTLAAGNYGDVTVGPNANVTLSGGDYFLKSLTVKPGGKLQASAPTTLHVTGRVLVGNTATFGPSPGSGVTPSDIVVYANGIDGPAKNPQNAIQFGSNSIIGVNAYAKRGTLSIGSDAVATGAFIGLRVDIATKVVLNLDSVFLAP